MWDSRKRHNMYDDDDAENIRPKKIKTLQTEGYKFVTKIKDFEEGEYVSEIKGQVLHKTKTVGSLKGWLINRQWQSNFFTSCDSVSRELQLLSNVLFHKSGRLRKINWSKEFDLDVLQRCSVGGFLNIDAVSINKKHRGKDLAYRFLQHLLHELHGQWTVSVIVPGLTEDFEVEGEAKKLKLDRICQLYARCGYKFLPIETNCSYWYLLPTELKHLSKDEVNNVHYLHISNEHWSDYKDSLHSIHSTACFEEALVDGYEQLRRRPANHAKAVERYEACISLMPPDVKNLLIEGVISPRMFQHLVTTAEVEADQCRMEVEDRKFPSRTLLSVDDFGLFMSLLEYIPENVTKNGIYKTFLTGLVKVIETISTIMSSTGNNRLPTVNRVMALLGTTRPPSHNHLFEKGGRIEHVLHGIIDIAKQQSWAYGDGTYDETFGEKVQSLPLVDILDHDFHYVETIVLKHLLEN